MEMKICLYTVSKAATYCTLLLEYEYLESINDANYILRETLMTKHIVDLNTKVLLLVDLVLWITKY